MADNIGYTPGAGATVAADDIGGVLHQRIKLGIGEDGTAVDVSNTNPMPVKDEDSIFLMNRILNSLDSPRGYDKSLQRQRGTVVVESGTVTTVTTVTTVSTVSNIATIDGLQPRIQIYGANLSAWRDCVRSCIS